MANRYHDGLLSDRQYTSLFLLGRGMRLEEIGKSFNASKGTVSAHLYRARKKLGASNNLQAFLRLTSGIEG